MPISSYMFAIIFYILLYFKYIFLFLYILEILVCFTSLNANIEREKNRIRKDKLAKIMLDQGQRFLYIRYKNK